MPTPTKPVIDYSYTGFQAEQQDFPFPGHQLDNDLRKLAGSDAGIIDALADIRRSDGKLKNRIVTADSLSDGLLIGIEPPADWLADVDYKAPDTVFVGDKIYRCLTPHHSTDFDDDLAAGFWEQIVDFSSVSTAAQEAADAAALSAGQAAASASAAAGSASSASASAVGAATNALVAANNATSAGNSAALAQAWAESATNPGDIGTKSAKTHAEDAAASALSAAKSADDAASVLAGSMQKTDYDPDGRGTAVMFAADVVDEDDMASDSDEKVPTQGSVKAYVDSKVLSPGAFGVIGDGVHDDTEAVRTYLAACAQTGRTADFSGVGTVSIQSDAEIAVNSSVDFGGARIKILNGIVPGTPGFDTYRVTFVVADPDTPLVTGVITPTDGNLAAGSRTPTADFWTDPGFVYFQGAGSNTPVISNRQGDGTLSFRQSFKVVKDGRVARGLALSMVGTTELYHRSRRNSKRGWVHIHNFQIDASQFNNQMVFLINRNQVKISDATVDYSGVIPVSINEIFAVIEASDFILENITGLAQSSFSGNGTYIAGLTKCAEVSFINCTAVNGWGWQGSADASGVTITRCKVNRFDIHNGGFYFYADNCDFCEHGVTFGWGGGDLVVSNSRAYNCDLVNSRQDYGGYWFGSMVATNIIFERDVGTTATVFNLESNPVGVPILALPLPSALVVRGVHRRTNPTSGATYIAPVRIRIAAGAQAMAAPETISVSDVSGAGNWSLFNTIDAMNTVGASNMRIDISNVHATRAQNTSDLTNLRTWVGIPAKFVVGTSANLDVVINGCSNVALDLSAHDGAPRANLTGCRYISRARGKTGGRCVATACDFTTPVLPSGETASPIGGTKGAGSFPITALLSCTFIGAWDLSAAVMLSGCMWAGSNDGNMVLPSGATQATAMSGWRSGF